MMLSLTGIQTGLLLTRSSLFKGWAELFRTKFGRNKEFVSLDAKRFSVDPRGTPSVPIPMNPVAPGTPSPKRVESANTADTYSSKDPNSPYSPHSQIDNGFERSYRQPRMSYSGPRLPPSTPPPQARSAWDSSSDTFARPATAGATYSPISPPRISNDHLHNRF